MMLQKSVKYIFFLILLTPFFQNCSQSQFNSSSPTEPDNKSAAVLGQYQIPISLTGSQLIVDGKVQLKEYVHVPTGRHFYTSRINDQNLLASVAYSSSFRLTGNSFSVSAATAAGLSPLYRFFNNNGFHSYTANGSDRTSLLADTSWNDEGIEGYTIFVNPNGSCPTSPSITYPVYKLYHALNYKNRFVFNDALKSQLLSQGYVNNGIAFCALKVDSLNIINPPTAQSCSFNGVNVPDGGSVTAFQYASVQTGSTCISQQRVCTNGTLSGNFTNTSCAVTPILNTSCQFGNLTIANGGWVTAFQNSLVPAGSTCVSEKRICNNTVLSGSYANVSCAISGGSQGQGTCTDQVGASNFVLDGNTDFGTPSVDARMEGSEIYVIEVKPGAYMSTAGKSILNLISWNVRSGSAAREVSVSTCRGDFTSSAAQILYKGSDGIGHGGGFTLTLDEPNRTAGISLRTVRMTSGKSYFINFRNVDCPGTSYGPDTCIMYWFAVPATN